MNYRGGDVSIPVGSSRAGETQKRPSPAVSISGGLTVNLSVHKMRLLVDALGYRAGRFKRDEEPRHARECLELAEELISSIRPVVDVGPRQV